MKMSFNFRLLLAAFSSSFLLSASMPGNHLGFLVFIALVPLLYFAMDSLSWNQRLFLGFSFGVFFHLITGYWMTQVSWIGYFLLMSCLALYLTAFVMLIYFLKDLSDISRGITIAILWGVLEFFKNHWFTGFPWHNIYSSLWEYPYLQSWVSILGPEFLSMLIVFVNIVIVQWIKSFQSKYLLIKFMLICFIFFGAWFYDNKYQIEQATWSRELNVGIVQANISQKDKWDVRLKEWIVNEYIRLSDLTISQASADLMVWPESCIPGDYLYDEYAREHIDSWVKKNQTPLLFGSMDNLNNDMEIFYNSAFWLDPSAEVQLQYNKLKLVPFGEYIPLKKWIPFIEKFTVGTEDFSAGDKLGLYQWKNMWIGVIICFEDSISSIIRELKHKNVDLVFNLTNDAWFGKTNAAFHHFSQSLILSRAFGLTVVRVCNTGISGIIYPDGNYSILKDSNGESLFVPITTIQKIKGIKINTFYYKYGKIIIPVCIWYLFLVFMLGIKKRRYFL